MPANQTSNNGFPHNPQLTSKMSQLYKQLIYAEAEVIGYKSQLVAQKEKSDQLEEQSKKLKAELATLTKKHAEVCQEVQQLRK
ncbi:MAG: hypothetical protein MUE44_08000 [Oscillatoriaceae cyanobacterium Prado104]|jgi:chromosome segregation ATPase|nr:hypothetical protein [Oscillatoriaceae cyanobacterium Prado104]